MTASFQAFGGQPCGHRCATCLIGILRIAAFFHDFSTLLPRLATEHAGKLSFV
jgi:hypothetical protein